MDLIQRLTLRSEPSEPMLVPSAEFLGEDPRWVLLIDLINSTQKRCYSPPQVVNLVRDFETVSGIIRCVVRIVPIGLERVAAGFDFPQLHSDVLQVSAHWGGAPANPFIISQSCVFIWAPWPYRFRRIGSA